MKQKILNLFLIVLMIFIFSPIISYANTSKPDGAKWLVDEGTNHVWYEITGNTLTIGGYGAMTEWNDTNYSTQPWRNNNIIDVVIENGITSIGAYSFYKILSITEVNFPTTLTSIGKYAFYENNIENLVLPEGLITISEYAFYHNENLITIVLPSTLKSIGDAGLRRNITETIISYNTNPPELGQNVFNSAGAAPTYLKKVIIPYNSETDYKNNSGWSKVLDEQLHGKEIPIFETYVIKTNITGEGSIIPSINNVLVSEYDSQKVNLTINYSSDYLLKSLEVLDADGNKISINKIK